MFPYRGPVEQIIWSRKSPITQTSTTKTCCKMASKTDKILLLLSLNRKREHYRAQIRKNLACYIRQDRNIHGLVINNKEIKLTLFADDVTCFLRDRLSYLHLLVILKFFSRFSGLSVNDDKTELFAIGPQKLQQEEFYHKTCTSIKILGIYFIITIRQQEGI